MTGATDRSSAIGRGDSDVLIEPPFFIVGSGRSGTTLLRSLLSAHSGMVVTPETHFLKSCIRLSGRPLDERPRNIDRVWREYCNTPRFAMLGVSREECEAYFPDDRDPTYADIFSAMLRAFGDEAGKVRVGEKTPSHFYQADWLLEHFPGSRIIIMRRDPRAMIASQLRTPWRKGEEDMWRSTLTRSTRLHSVLREAKLWQHVNGTLLPELERNPRAIAVRYEDLVREPEKALRRVADHLGEEFEPQMLQERDVALVDPAQAGMNPEWTSMLREHEAKAQSSVGTASIDKWRDQLSEMETAVIEGVTADTMGRFGYDAFATQPSKRRRALLSAKSYTIACDVELRARRGVRALLGPKKSGPAPATN